jgi:hypothetical protein
MNWFDAKLKRPSGSDEHVFINGFLQMHQLGIEMPHEIGQ